jgi:hypothetical protein
VQNTWGKRCDGIVFATSKAPADGLNLPYILVDIGEATEDRELLWRKSQQAWLRSYHEHSETYDWFLRADDDTYVDIDNLR